MRYELSDAEWTAIKPRQFPHELVEASEALAKREAFMVRSSRSPAPPA